MNFSIKRMLVCTAKTILVTVFLGLATEAKAEDRFNLYSQGYKSPQKSAMTNKRYATAYRLRETPYFAVKTNILHDLTSSINLGVEARLEQKITLDLPVTYNPWMYNKDENSKFKFVLFQPELRLWTCEAFDGHYFGLHAHYAYFNVGRLPQPFSDVMYDYRYEGQLAGAGISYGYVWPVSARWGLEAEIGVGYARLWYDRYPCENCAKLLSNEKRNYFGITRAGISLIYYIF